MTDKLSDKDKKDWQNFLNSSDHIYSKDKEDILHKFEPITLEMLAEYGSDQIVLYKINNNEYYMTF